MSHQSYSWVLRDGPRLDDVDRHGKRYGARARGYRAVLASIANAANSDGEHAHPGQQTMSDESLYGRRQVITILGELIAEGWIGVQERGGGKGKATVYRVRMDRRVTVQPLRGSDSANRAVLDDKPRDASVDTARSATDTEQSHVSDLQERAHQQPLNVEPNEPTQRASSDDDAGAEIESLCQQLADRVEQFRGGMRPKVTPRWRNDMRLLIEYGPKDCDDKVTVAKVRVSIDALFTELAEPDKGGFCWAQQVRSPAALRRHWASIATTFRTIHHSRVGRGAQAVDRVAHRLARDGAESTKREPLGLLVEHEPKELGA